MKDEKDKLLFRLLPMALGMSLVGCATSLPPAPQQVEIPPPPALSLQLPQTTYSERVQARLKNLRENWWKLPGQPTNTPQTSK